MALKVDDVAIGWREARTKGRHVTVSGDRERLGFRRCMRALRLSIVEDTFRLVREWYARRANVKLDRRGSINEDAVGRDLTRLSAPVHLCTCTSRMCLIQQAGVERANVVRTRVRFLDVGLSVAG